MAQLVFLCRPTVSG